MHQAVLVLDVRHQLFHVLLEGFHVLFNALFLHFALQFGHFHVSPGFSPVQKRDTDIHAQHLAILQPAIGRGEGIACPRVSHGEIGAHRRASLRFRHGHGLLHLDKALLHLLRERMVGVRQLQHLLVGHLQRRHVLRQAGHDGRPFPDVQERRQLKHALLQGLPRFNDGGRGIDVIQFQLQELVFLDHSPFLLPFRDLE